MPERATDADRITLTRNPELARAFAATFDSAAYQTEQEMLRAVMRERVVEHYQQSLRPVLGALLALMYADVNRHQRQQ